MLLTHLHGFHCEAYQLPAVLAGVALPALITFGLEYIKSKF